MRAEVERLIALAESRPGARRRLRALRSGDPPEAWLLLHEAFGGRGSVDHLRAVGVLAGTFRHRPGLHPARALKERLERLRRILAAPTGPEMAEALARQGGLVEELDLVEACLAVFYWSPRRAIEWARRAYAEKEAKEAKEEA